MTNPLPAERESHAWTFHEPPGARWRHYRLNGETHTPSGLKIASVTQILSVLDKPALVGWSANVTAEGAFDLARPKTRYRRCPKCKGVSRERSCPKVKAKVKCGTATVTYQLPGHWRQLQADLKSAGLDHNSTRDEAAFRGTSIHKLHEDWVNDGKVPNPAEYPKAWHGYVTSYVKWLLWMQDMGAEFTASEAIVGSVTHGFAGKCDEVAVITSKDGRRERLDFKTSRQTYARTHFRQLAGYELADVEMGNEPTDRQGIVILPEDGDFDPDYHIAWSTATAEDFINVVKVWRDEQPLKKQEDEAYRARKAREKAARAKAKEGSK